MSDEMFWLEGTFLLTDPEKLKEMNNLILELLRKTGICRLTTKTIAGKTMQVVSKAVPDECGIIQFDYSIFERIKRNGNYYDTKTGKLVTPDRGYNHFGFTMNLIMTVLEAYSETPCFFMQENELSDITGPAAVIEELTGKVLNFERRARAFDTLTYFRKIEKFKCFKYSYKDFPFDYYLRDYGQSAFVFLILNEPIAPVEEPLDSEFKKNKEMAFLCLELFNLTKELKDEALEYISKLMDMSLEEREKEAEREHPLSFIASVSVFLPAAYLIKIYAEAFDMDYFELWYQIGKEGYWDVKGLCELIKKPRTASKKHRLYRVYKMKNEDDFIGLWEGDEIILSNITQENIEDYKQRYCEIDDNSLSDYDTIAGLIRCIDDLQSFWNIDKYVEYDLLEEFMMKKDDIRYKKAVMVLRMLIDDEIALFSEFTELQVRKWILKKFNRKKLANKYWHYAAILSNKERRNGLLGF